VSRRFETAHVDDLDSFPGPGSLTWRPVRSRFDIRAFGCNAYTANLVGDHVVEPHDEEGELGVEGHQELYFVHSGCAEFTVDDETFRADAGTYVWLPDPSAHREATALEESTTVLSFGGPPTFKPSEWEYRWRATRSGVSPEESEWILKEGLAEHPGHPGLRLAQAELALAQGDEDRAESLVKEVIAAEPGIAGWIGENESFERIAGNPRTAAAAGLDKGPDPG
jgi:hypothetical protein